MTEPIKVRKCGIAELGAEVTAYFILIVIAPKNKFDVF